MPQTQRPAPQCSRFNLKPQSPPGETSSVPRSSALREFIDVLDSISETDLETLATFKLIMDRDRGCTTPVETFLVSLVRDYGMYDNDGEGLTLENIEFEMKQHLLDDGALSRAIEEAHFLASRYPLPKSNGEAASETQPS